MSAESALVALVPEAQELVETYRRLYDLSAATGVPAHVTILYPFKPPADLTAETISALRELYSSAQRFSVTFAEIRSFADVLYLAPAPAEPFRRLTELTAGRFPEAQPYGGEFADIVPHLTVAQAGDSQRLEEIASAFRLAAAGRMPVRAEVQSVALMDNSSGQWRVREHFALRHAG